MSATTSVQAATRHQQRVEELCAAAIRAISGDAALHFKGRRLHRAHQRLPLFAPHLHPSLEDDDFASFRGAADGLALRLKHSDAALHQSLLPAAPLQRLLFDLLEQIRVESQVSPSLPGAARNLRHRHDEWSLAFHRSRLTETARGILLFTVTQVCRARVTGEPVLEETEDLMEATRAAISPALGGDLMGLRRNRETQAQYAVHALAIARLVADMLGSADEEEAGAKDDSKDKDTERAAFSLMMDLQADELQDISAAVTGHSPVLDGFEGRYKIFTTAYDREVKAATLVPKAQLRTYREQLDLRIAGQGVNVARLARELKILLAVPERDGWDSAQEEGYIDGRRLAQLISSPTERRLFRTERVEPVAHCCVSFLIDCSGSMKQHIESVAMVVDVFARVLEMAGIASEILGFTTGAWNGGRALRDWRRSGKPQHPGRLNEVCHMVFKDVDTSWRKARPDIAALLKPELFREGIDGEAFEWACRRLNASHHERRLLFVISDGCPMDSATNLANDTYYLDNHLKDVVACQEERGQISVFGIGVGLDLSPYYDRSRALDFSAGVGNDVFRDILRMMAGHSV
jgi:cobaltochelatase CobT